MSLVELIILLLVAGVAGAIGQAIGGYQRGGFLLAIVLGFVGAVIGTWLAAELNLPLLFEITVGGTTFPLLWAIIGAALFVALVGLFGGTGGDYWGVTPPTRVTLGLSILLAILAFLVASGSLATITISAFTLLVVAYILLLLGNLLKGI